MVEISASDYIKTHRGLLRLLEEIAESGKNGVATRKLCEKVMHSRNCAGLLESMESDGLIKRQDAKAQGKGNNRKINYITDKGKNLLAELHYHHHHSTSQA